MFKSINFKNYKCFEEKQKLEIKPLTVLIGKNGSGKSAVARLPLLVFQSLFEGTKGKPIELNIQETIFGESFEDILFNKYATRTLEFDIELVLESADININAKIQNLPELKKQIVSSWSVTNNSKKSEEKIALTWNGDDKIIGYHESDSLKNNNEDSVSINFKGLLPISKKSRISHFAKMVSDCKFDISYLTAIRASTESLYSKDHSFFSFENDGSSVPELLYKQNLLLQKVSNWFEKYLDGWQLETQTIKGNYFELLLKHESNPSVKINITQTGLGFSQVMPVIAAAYLIKSGDLFIIEEPEQHLHPAVHGDVAELLATQAKKVGASFLIETHSKNFILRLRRLVAEGKLNPSDVIIYWIDNEESEGKSCLKEITIDSKGMVSEWPEGVFSEDLDEILEIRKAQRQNEKT